MNEEQKLKIKKVFHRVNQISDLLLEVTMDLGELIKSNKDKQNDKVQTKTNN